MHSNTASTALSPGLCAPASVRRAQLHHPSDVAQRTRAQHGAREARGHTGPLPYGGINCPGGYGDRVDRVCIAADCCPLARWQRGPRRARPERTQRVAAWPPRSREHARALREAGTCVSLGMRFEAACPRQHFGARSTRAPPPPSRQADGSHPWAPRARRACIAESCNTCTARRTSACPRRGRQHRRLRLR